jgi:hypothetical protein
VSVDCNLPLSWLKVMKQGYSWRCLSSGMLHRIDW